MKKFLLILLTLIIIVTSFIVFFYLKKENAKVPVIKLIGDKEITLKVFDEYVEPGAKAKYAKDDISKSILIKSDVDTNKVGSYKVTYQIKYKDKKASTERIVNVVDQDAPVIKLNGDETVSIYVNDKYEDKGVTATDNYDGDITSKVILSGNVDVANEGTYELVYKVSDSSGNEAEVKRVITVKKRPVPTVTTTTYVQTGKGGLPVLMYHFFYDDTIGKTGNDANWMAKTAFESQMKYLSDNNFYFPSWQEVEDYIDGKISLPPKSVVITVDDGDVTFLDIAVPIIEKYNVKATSFAVGVWNGDGIYQHYSSDHLNVQSHSYDAHKAGRNGKGLLVNLDLEEVKNDLSKSRDMMGNSTVFCYPFGHYNDTVIQGLKETGYHMAFTTNGGRVFPGQDKYKLPRVRMSRGISLASFAQSVG